MVKKTFRRCFSYRLSWGFIPWDNRRRAAIGEVAAVVAR
jgi:hypothetical protein